MANKSGIHINPANKGKFNALKKKTGKSTEELTHSKNSLTKKRAVFAQNAAKWNKGQNGITLSQPAGTTAPSFTPYKGSNIPQLTYPDKSTPSNINWGDTALASFMAIDALLPPEPSPYPVVRPGLSYNEHPSGTGSQAIADKGITISTTGYKSTSKDRKKSKLRIPSGNITMEGVGFPVLGTDNLGNTQYMTPGNNYQFPGSYVDEIPMAQQGTTLKPIYTNNPKDPRIQAYNDSLKLYNQSLTKEKVFDKFAKDNNLKVSESKGNYFATENPNIAPVNTKGFLWEGMTNNIIPNGGQSDGIRGAAAQTFMKGLTDYNTYGGRLPLYKKPVQPVIYQKPQRPKGALLDPNIQMPNMGDSGVRPTPRNMNMPRADYDFSKKTKYAFAYPDEQGQQQNMYFPDAKTLKEFEKGARNVSSQEGDGYRTSTGYMKYGGTMKKKKRGMELCEDGITILDENTVKFTGDKHSDPSGGQPISYGGKSVMVEGDETGYLSPVDQSLTIMGNMKNPLTGRKFKSDSKILSEKEAKMDILQDEGLSLINDNNPMDKWSSLKFNSGKAMLTGAHKKKQELLSSKEHLKAIQEAMLATSIEEEAPIPQAKNGLTMPSAQRGISLPDGRRVTYKKWLEIQKKTSTPTPLQTLTDTPSTSMPEWKYNSTNVQGLDPKIKEFTQLLMKKGLTGYSGPESGVSQRNTKQGRASRHASGEALDAFFSQPDAYNKVLADPELSKYLIDNGLTVINEYDPETAKKTGASAGHLHIGYDKGTGVSDKFRQDAAAKYKASSPTWAWGTTRNPKGKTIKGAPQGDQQYFPYEGGNVEYNVTGGPSSTSTTQKKPLPNYDFNFTAPSPYSMPSNAQGLEFTQILPELYTAATNKVEPVHLQKYQPELYEPYQVSFQDQLNENQATFSATQKAAAYNPSALATLGAQKYSADSSALANEFRTNQGIANDITNKNIKLINDAELTNLQLADTQYTRQSQAKSNTKAINHGVLNSISSKILQNEANQNKTKLYENLYRFRFDPDNLQAYNAGPGGAEYVDWNGEPSPSSTNPSQSISVRKDAYGRVQGSTTTTPSINTQQLQEYGLKKKKYTPIASMFNKKGGISSSFADWMASQGL